MLSLGSCCDFPLIVSKTTDFSESKTTDQVGTPKNSSILQITLCFRFKILQKEVSSQLIYESKRVYLQSSVIETYHSSQQYYSKSPFSLCVSLLRQLSLYSLNTEPFRTSVISFLQEVQ